MLFASCKYITSTIIVLHIRILIDVSIIETSLIVTTDNEAYQESFTSQILVNILNEEKTELTASNNVTKTSLLKLVGDVTNCHQPSAVQL